RVADASWYLPQSGRAAKLEYQSAHIPGAVFFDIDDLSDEKNPLPHMLAPAPKFASRMRRLGLGDGNMIIAYDAAGIYSSPRAGGRPGPIPGAISIPYRALAGSDGTLKSRAELRDVFGTHGLDPAMPVVTTCGSGITAATLMLALAAAGTGHVALYDGSWADW